MIEQLVFILAQFLFTLCFIIYIRVRKKLVCITKLILLMQMAGSAIYCVAFLFTRTLAFSTLVIYCIGFVITYITSLLLVIYFETNMKEG